MLYCLAGRNKKTGPGKSRFIRKGRIKDLITKKRKIGKAPSGQWLWFDHSELKDFF
jgi:hypothetical protein